MKISKFFAIAAMGTLLLSSVSCEDPNLNNNGGGDEPEKPASEAKITSFNVTAGTAVIEGKIFEADKAIELPYLPDQLTELAAATAEVILSEGATISPDPATATDYTVEGGVKFTVTSKDGAKSVTYTVELAAAQFQNKVELVWEKTFGEMGIAAMKYQWNCGIGFSGLNIVTTDCQVFDLEGNKVGDLNLEGIPGATAEGFQLVCLSNDRLGALFGSVAFTSEGEFTTDLDKAVGNIYVWKEGWDKPATLVVDGEAAGANFAQYFSVSGDVNGSFIITHPTPVRGGTQMHHCRAFSNGNLAEPAWSAFYVPYPSNDGNWGQMVSHTSGKVDGMFIIGDSRADNKGYRAVARLGLTGEDVDLFGTLKDDEIVEDGDDTCLNQYGNYSAGHVRGFQYNGEDYVVVSSSGWPQAYVTIQPTDPEKDYLLRTTPFNTASSTPSSAFVFDEATGVGHVVVFIGSNYELVRYDISTEIM